MHYDLGVVGHIVLDYLMRHGIIRGPFLGGPSVYANLAACAIRASATAVSVVGKDFGPRRLTWLGKRGVDTANVRVASSMTTQFHIQYRDGTRNLMVPTICKPISARDASALRSCRAVHIGPIIGEVSDSLALQIAKENFPVSLDPQGFVRRRGEDGVVGHKAWRNTKLLKRLWLLKPSEREFRYVLGGRFSARKFRRLGPEVLLVTMGEKGTLLWSREEGGFRVPAYPTTVLDPTGAGDAQVGGLLTTWFRTGDLVWSAAVGSAVASFVVERFGPASFGSPKRIESRAEKILERIQRL